MRYKPQQKKIKLLSVTLIKQRHLIVICCTRSMHLMQCCAVFQIRIFEIHIQNTNTTYYVSETY